MLRMRVLVPGLVALFVGLASVPAEASPPGMRGLARIAEGAQGAKIRTNPSAAWQALAPGARIPVGAEITSDRAVSIQLANGGRIELTAGARIALAGTIDVVVGRTLATTRIDVREGEIAVDMPKSASLRAAVLCSSGELLSLVQPGASARMLAQAARFVVGSYEGGARVAADGAWKELPAGHVATLSKGDRVGAPAAMNPGPKWAPEDGTSVPLRIVTSADVDAALKVSWSRVENAAGYVVELARDDGFGDMIGTFETDAEKRTFETPELATGRYHVRVRSRGASGLPGLAGPARTLRIARVNLPAGARTDRGAVVLPLSRVATFDDPNGLELSLSHRTFMAAPSGFGIASEKAITAHVRLAGERASVPLKIVPSALHADIEIGPKTAVWPKDPVQIAVRLADPGHAVPDFEPSLDVRIDLEPLAVTWHRDGAVWRTTIAPRRSAGPFVIRVEAKDPEGGELGRAHLEVVGLRD